MSWRGYRLASILTQWLSSVYNNQWLDTWDRTLPDAAVILRDQAEGHLLFQMNYIAAWWNIPEWSLNHSTGDVNQTLGSADYYLSSGGRVNSEGETSVGWGLTGTGLRKLWHLLCAHLSLSPPFTVTNIASFRTNEWVQKDVPKSWGSGSITGCQLNCVMNLTPVLSTQQGIQ